MEKGQKILRQGYTTGSCATAATRGALSYLLGNIEKNRVAILTPKGKTIEIPLSEYERGSKWAKCAAQKDSGDDPDVTNGVLVYSKVTIMEHCCGEVAIDGGLGVGRVTKPGLARPVGEAAINPGPLKMIEEEARQTMEIFGYEGGVKIEISIPQGVELARKTFNPKLGIKGGISVLGTSGIVEPMSEKALVDTIKVEIDVFLAAGGKSLVITPGNYGETFLEGYTNIPRHQIVKCSNFIGDTLNYASRKGIKSILLVGHIGKLIKVAGGAYNTHSKEGDRRMELLEYYAKKANVAEDISNNIENCVSTEEAISQLKAGDNVSKVLAFAMEDMESHCKKIMIEALSKDGSKNVLPPQIGVMVYSNQHGLLGETTTARAIIKSIDLSNIQAY